MEGMHDLWLKIDFLCRVRVNNTKVIRSGLLIITILTLWSCSQAPKRELLIAASSNMRFALDSIAQQFERQSGIHCEVITASSGKLYAQIINQAPYDLFLSADLIYPNKLNEQNLTWSEPKVYALGRLGLWTLNEEITLSPDWIFNDQVKRIALANPETAPYGRAAAEALQHWDRSNELQGKWVMGENVSQAAQFVSTQSAQVGFLPVSLLMKQEGQWVLIPDTLHEPIEQGVVRLKNHTGAKEDIEKFYTFLFSQECQSILKDHGYVLTGIDEPTDSVL